MVTVWKKARIKAIGVVTMNKISTKTNLPDMSHPLHPLDHCVHHFLASAEPILVIGVHKTLCDVQNFIDLIHRSLLTTITKS